MRDPIVILAGAGQLPVLLSQCLVEQGREHRILAFRGFAERSLCRKADAVVDLLNIKATLACLERWNAKIVTLAGAVHRPAFAVAFNAFSLFGNARDVRAILTRGDDHVLRGAVGMLEERGYRVVGLHDLAPSLLAKQEIHGRYSPSDEMKTEIAFGIRVLQSVSAYDIGQAVVISGERVLAIEGPEGTDGMLARAGRLGRGWLRRSLGGGVLVKAAKQGQDLRVDLPAIGPRTICKAAAAGLKGVAIGAGTGLILDLENAVEEADRLGLFLIGIDASSQGSIS